jgi:hypothetical protein
VPASTLWRCGGRQCGSGECEHGEGELHRRSSGPGPEHAPPLVHEVLGSSSSPLPTDVRFDMERRLGHHFADVRIHTGPTASESALQVEARAYTVGRDVVFAPGQFTPGTEVGNRLLAHELAHTMQRSAPTSGDLRVSSPNEAAEREASAIADSATSAGATAVAAQQPQPGLGRLPFGIRLPSGGRWLDATEISLATGAYGSSIALGSIVITDALGGGGRPFTTALPLGFVALNLGPGPYGTPASNPDLLVHELAHAWQSQHHPNPAAFMANSVASQAAGGRSAYCYVPGKWFGAYGAEQIAQQSENGVAAIRSHMRGVSAGATDPANVVAMAVPRWETPGAPGVVC